MKSSIHLLGRGLFYWPGNVLSKQDAVVLAIWIVTEQIKGEGHVIE